MGVQQGRRNQAQDDFSQMITKAYERGTNDNDITVRKMIEKIKSDLMKMKAKEE